MTAPYATMTRRADFVAANRGLRVARAGFVLLAYPNGGQGMRVGFTVTKKIGNAVVRNRMKRRLRALVREILPAHGLANTDHVLIGRESGIERDFALLREELLMALSRAQAGKGDPPRRHPSGKRSGGGKRPGGGKPAQNSGKPTPTAGVDGTR
ncbi:ribonuclease P protein component [Novosphingobium sp. 9]|uniref:ribonuclease P protein component n=1 Tax=Novosphingobium sp. 9 TaxID=2025349 RepID=UPI0021B68139|nr:ribonuclease P protein component [Novosphingobium sp. 9]